MYRVILEQREKIQKEIRRINKARFEDKDNFELNNRMNQLKKKYMYYNNLLKKV